MILNNDDGSQRYLAMSVFAIASFFLGGGGWWWQNDNAQTSFLLLSVAVNVLSCISVFLNLCETAAW